MSGNRKPIFQKKHFGTLFPRHPHVEHPVIFLILIDCDSFPPLPFFSSFEGKKCKRAVFVATTTSDISDLFSPDKTVYFFLLPSGRTSHLIAIPNPPTPPVRNPQRLHKSLSLIDRPHAHTHTTTRRGTALPHCPGPNPSLRSMQTLRPLLIPQPLYHHDLHTL